jgi:hypothetical protein
MSIAGKSLRIAIRCLYHVKEHMAVSKRHAVIHNTMDEYGVKTKRVSNKTQKRPLVTSIFVLKKQKDRTLIRQLQPISKLLLRHRTIEIFTGEQC